MWQRQRQQDSHNPGSSRWEVAWDVKHSRWYYIDRRDGTSSWTKPGDCDIVLPRETSKPWRRTRPCTPEKDCDDIPSHCLRAGWEAAWDMKTQRWYFFNRDTQQRVWDIEEVCALVENKACPEDMSALEGKARPEEVRAPKWLTEEVRKLESPCESSRRMPCKMGCGRLACRGFTRSGKPFDTCCRGCATGGDHDASCRRDAVDLKQEESRSTINSVCMADDQEGDLF